MIRVERDQKDDNGDPIRPSKSWFDRATAATERAVAEGEQHEVSVLYRDDEVRKALEELFHRKCAYCESRLGTVSPEEVEHYRPKGAVTERRDHPGYKWLAYAWTNLYPACTYCNQRRRDRPTWHEPETGPAAGKSTSFPLEDESQRAMSSAANLSLERPLLLDPCTSAVDPERLLRYDVRGEIHPADPEAPRARETIRICNLRRRRLRDARARAIHTTSKIVTALNRARAQLGSDDSIVVELEQLLDEQVADPATYAGAARYVLRDPGAFSIG